MTPSRRAAATTWWGKWWPWVAIILVSMFLVGRSQLQAEQIGDAQDALKPLVARTHQLTVVNRNLVSSLQAAIVESCEQNGNARARVDREQLNEEIGEAKHPDPEAFHALVEAGIPPRVIWRSEAKERVKLEGRLKRVKVVKCAKQYQISPGSGQRRQDRLENATP